MQQKQILKKKKRFNQKTVHSSEISALVLKCQMSIAK